MIVVVRLSHRLPRDERMTTHVALVARAFGASRMFYSGIRDRSMEQSVKKVVEQWGGSFEVVYCSDAVKKLKELKHEGFKIVHLTMYGKRAEDVDVRGNIAVVVGGEEVPRSVYDIADHNLAITNQPHSEVGALAVFLYMLNGLSLEAERERFKNAKLVIIPSEKGKLVRRF